VLAKKNVRNQVPYLMKGGTPAPIFFFFFFQNPNKPVHRVPNYSKNNAVIYPDNLVLFNVK
jgi:hypothetical protein